MRRRATWLVLGLLVGLAPGRLPADDGTAARFFRERVAPVLERRCVQCHGGKVELFQSVPGAVMKRPWEWRPRGGCGKFVSDLVPHLGGCVDDMAFLHAMVSKSNVHGPAKFLQTTGFVLPGFPGMGAWVAYGLGSLNHDLPTFVVLPDSRGFAPNGPANWGPGFLPAAYQGTLVRPSAREPIYDLFPPEEMPTTPEAEGAGLALVNRLNRAHREGREGDSRLDARIASYELAARLQLSAPGVLDLSGESDATKRLYGLDDPVTEDFGRNCLIARRLLERGVRFVQVWSGSDNGFPRRNWDSHEDIARDHAVMARSMDKPAAALIRDLKARGLLNDTVVYWTTEFGRMPCSQGAKGPRPQPVRLHLLARRRRRQGGYDLQPERRVVVPHGRRPRLRLRPPRHRSPPAGHRSHEADAPT